MPRARCRGWLVLVPFTALSGCCWMCDRLCPHPVQSAPQFVPVCCPAPVCCPPPAGSPLPAPYPPQYQQSNWSNPQQRAPVQQVNCCQ